MSKTLNELASELKEYIYDMNSSGANSRGFKKYKYNNLKIEVLDPRVTKIPQIKISIGISEAIYAIETKERVTGGLGSDEKFVRNWLLRDNVEQNLRDAWKRAEKQIGKITAAE